MAITPEMPEKLDLTDDTIEDVEWSSRPAIANINGEHHIYIPPGNFPGILDAYMNNRDGEKSDRLEIQANQMYLLTAPLGRVITEALDRLIADENNQELYALFAQVLSQTDVNLKEYYYSLIIDKITEYMPPVLSSDILRDPWAHEAAA